MKITAVILMSVVASAIAGVANLDDLFQQASTACQEDVNQKLLGAAFGPVPESLDLLSPIGIRASDQFRYVTVNVPNFGEVMFFLQSIGNGLVLMGPDDQPEAALVTPSTVSVCNNVKKADNFQDLLNNRDVQITIFQK